MRTSPQSLPSEQALLGQMMKSPDSVIPILIGIDIKAEDFYRRDHGELYKLVRSMFANRDVIDSVTVPEKVAGSGRPDKYGGIAYCMSLPDMSPSVANPGYYAEQIMKAARARSVIDVANALIDKAHGGYDMGDEISKAIPDLADLKLTDRHELPTDWNGAFKQHMKYKEDVVQSGGISKVPTGLYPLDGLLGGGLNMGTLNILAARPSMGKTALAMNIALNVARAGHGAGVCSIEMSRKMIMDRLLSTISGIPLTIMEDPTTWDQCIYDLLDEARESMSGQPFRLSNPITATVQDIIAMARKWKEQDDIKLLVIDYLGKIKLDGDRHVALGQACDDLKGLANELDIAVLLIHSVNRNVEGVPGMDNLKDSGDIEYHADIVAFVDRPAYYGAKACAWDANIHIPKFRQGRPGRCALHWWGAYQRFISPTDPPNSRPVGLMRSKI